MSPDRIRKDTTPRHHSPPNNDDGAGVNYSRARQDTNVDGLKQQTGDQMHGTVLPMQNLEDPMDTSMTLSTATVLAPILTDPDKLSNDNFEVSNVTGQIDAAPNFATVIIDHSPAISMKKDDQQFSKFAATEPTLHGFNLMQKSSSIHVFPTSNLKDGLDNDSSPSNMQTDELYPIQNTGVALTSLKLTRSLR
ncbi:hypothetical protein ACOSP7_002421 [Xanthoceras sorbifolium]